MEVAADVVTTRKMMAVTDNKTARKVITVGAAVVVIAVGDFHEEALGSIPADVDVMITRSRRAVTRNKESSAGAEAVIAVEASLAAVLASIHAAGVAASAANPTDLGRRSPVDLGLFPKVTCHLQPPAQKLLLGLKAMRLALDLAGRTPSPVTFLVTPGLSSTLCVTFLQRQLSA
jgi:hypothetical protein